MALQRRAVLVLAGALLLAGCTGLLPDQPTPTPADIEPRIAGTFSTGGQCVESPTRGLDVSGQRDDGVMAVTVAGNATVPGAHYVIDGFAVARTGPTRFRLDVNTTTDPDKPDRDCTNGGVVRYEVSLELPGTNPFALEIREDGEPVATLGAGG